MKLLVVLSALVATALARPGYLGAAGISGLLGNSIGAPALAGPGLIGGAGAAYLTAGRSYLGAGGAPVGGPANIVIGRDGVPADTPEVAAAKASHEKVVAETQARDAAQAAADAASGVYPGVGAGYGAGFGPGFGVGAIAGGGAPGAGLAVYGPANIVIGPDGVPHDTPEVASAKAAHADVVVQTQARDAAQAAADAASGAAGIGYAAANAASGAAGVGYGGVGYGGVGYGGVGYGGVGYAGVRLGAAAASSQGLLHYGPANIQIGPGGVPLDTPEVAAGKVADAVAHLHAKARLGLIPG